MYGERESEVTIMAEIDEYAKNRIVELEAKVAELLGDVLSASEQLAVANETERQLNEEVERLNAGGCRFNCRNQKEAFMAGHAAGENHIKRMYTEWSASPDEAYEQWRASK